MTWLAIGVAAGCKRSAALPAEVNEAAPVVYVVNYPLQYFAERVGGDAVDVRFPAPRDGDPALWKPDTDAIAEYQSADLILLNGATYAKWIPRASLPTSRMIDTSASFGERLIDIEADTTHSHGPAGEHAHGGTAFTTWLDFDQAIAQAQAVHDALARRRPANADAFGANLEALTNDLRKFDEQLMSIAREIDGEPLVASHPVYQYWARRYGFNLQSVTLEPDVVPDDRAMGVLKTILADHPAKIMIWEGDPDPPSVELLRTIGVRSVVFDPCGNIPDEGDFLTAMKRNTEALREVLAAVSAAPGAEPIAVAMQEPPDTLLRQSPVRPHLPKRLNEVVDREFGIGGERLGGLLRSYHRWAASFQKLGCRPQHPYLCCGRPASQVLLESVAFPRRRWGPNCWCRGCFWNGQNGQFSGTLGRWRAQHKPNRNGRFGVSYPPGYDMA